MARLLTVSAILATANAYSLTRTNLVAKPRAARSASPLCFFSGKDEAEEEIGFSLPNPFSGDSEPPAPKVDALGRPIKLRSDFQMTKDGKPWTKDDGIPDIPTIDIGPLSLPNPLKGPLAVVTIAAIAGSPILIFGFWLLLGGAKPPDATPFKFLDRFYPPAIEKNARLKAAEEKKVAAAKAAKEAKDAEEKAAKEKEAAAAATAAKAPAAAAAKK